MISSTCWRTASSEMPRRLERLGGDALALVDEAEQDVLGADVVVVEHPGLFLGQDDDPASPVGEPLEHLHSPHHEQPRGGWSRKPSPGCTGPHSRLTADPCGAFRGALRRR